MQEFKVVIPSYRRSGKQETLEYMHKLGFPLDRVYIFVQTKEDYGVYSTLYGNICNVVYAEAQSIPVARNNILNYFGGEENLLMMDDDVSSIAIGSKNSKFRSITNTEQFESVVSEMFETTSSMGGFLFGLYPVYNEFFMSDDISTRVTVNTIIGFPKGFPYRFNESYIAKEDIELCGRIIYGGGKVIRFNNVAFKAKHRTNAGGAYETWKSDANIKLSKELCMRFPGIFALQKNKPQEVRVVIKDVKRRGKEWTIA